MSDFKFETLNETQIRALAVVHERMYENRIRRAGEGVRGIRVDECTKLLGIWRSVTVKLGQGNWRLRFTKAEINEIKEAIESGEFDGVLLATKDAPS